MIHVLVLAAQKVQNRLIDYNFYISVIYTLQ